MEEVSCCRCGGYFPPDPRQKNPRYCRKLGCQRARKAAWQRAKIRADPDYQADQKRCWQDWCKVHPAYWKEYRQQHPDQARRNRDLQRMRNTRRRSRGRDDPPGMKGSMIAKMDASAYLGTSSRATFSGQFWLVPVIAKMDALKVNIYGITESCE
jgi:hypothetical protein